MSEYSRSHAAFFIKHYEIFKLLLSSYYSFNDYQITKYKKHLNLELLLNNLYINWNSSILKQFKSRFDWETLSINPSVFKDISLIDEFYDLIHWDSMGLSAYTTIANNLGLPWSKEFIERYENSWDYYQMSYNPNIPWTEELIDKHINEWDWQTLSGNDMLPWSLDFIKKYSNRIVFDCFDFQVNNALTSNFEIVEEYGHLLSWQSICSNQNLPWVEKDLLEYWKNRIDFNDLTIRETLSSNINYRASNIEKFLNNQSDFRSISSNEKILWSTEIIDKYIDRWSWKMLSLNKSLPWSYEFIKRYSEYLHWGKVTIENVTFDSEDNELEYETFQTYKDYYDKGIESNTNIPWSLDLINSFEDKLDLEMLIRNESVWEKAFKPYINDELIDLVFRII